MRTLSVPQCPMPESELPREVKMLGVVWETQESEGNGNGERLLCLKMGQSLISLDASCFCVRFPESSVSLERCS